jgi:hypothetical protein
MAQAPTTSASHGRRNVIIALAAVAVVLVIVVALLASGLVAASQGSSSKPPLAVNVAGNVSIRPTVVYSETTACASLTPLQVRFSCSPLTGCNASSLATVNATVTNGQYSAILPNNRDYTVVVTDEGGISYQCGEVNVSSQSSNFHYDVSCE